MKPVKTWPAGRGAYEQNRRGLIDGLDAVVHSVDAEEFLEALAPLGCLIQAAVLPAFLHAPSGELPAIGKRLIIAIRSTTT